MTKFSRKTRAAVVQAVAGVDAVVQSASRDLTNKWNDAQTLAATYWTGEGADGKTLASVRAVEAFLAGYSIATAWYSPEDKANGGRPARLARELNGARSYEALATLAGFHAADYTRAAGSLACNLHYFQAALDAVDADLVAARKAADDARRLAEYDEAARIRATSGEVQTPEAVDAFDARCKAALGINSARVQFVRG